MKKHKHEHRHPDSKKTISELLAAGQGSAIMPGDIMEKLYDHKEAERLEEEKRANERRKSKKKRKKKAKKVSQLSFIHHYLLIARICWFKVLYKVLVLQESL